MRIKRLELKNFRGFEELTINFPEDSNVAVFVGVNGAGKTSLLECCLFLLQTFYKKISGSKKKIPLTENDIKIDEESTVSELLLDIASQEISIFSQISRSYKNGQSKLITKTEGEYYRLLENDLKLNKGITNLPLISFYPTNRFIPASENLFTNQYGSHNLNPFDAFDNAFSTTLGYYQFFNWFKRTEDYENEQRLRQDKNYRNRDLQAVRKSFESFSPNFSNPRIERPLERQIKENFVINKGFQKLSIHQLSHGERGFLTLLGDIARRLSIANPGLDDPLQGEGVVLIDEIELHLHPGWQRKIVPLLTKTFPNIQFIITTHSPQVISTINKESVFLLENFQLKKVPATLGRDSNSILEEIFLIPERPEGINEKLEKVYELMNDPDKINEAKALLQEIEQKYEVSRDEEVMQAKMHLEFLEG